MSGIVEIVISDRGVARSIYSDDLDLKSLGPLNIRRASHVEPNSVGQWLADLTPVSGPVLGPFPMRSQALNAETDWLREHWLLT